MTISTIQALKKIEAVLEKLLEQAATIDQANMQRKSHVVIRDKALFFQGLFSTDSDKFVDYVVEVKSKTEELARLLSSNKKLYSHQRLMHVEQQISSLINALNSNNAMHQQAQQQLNANKARNFKRAAKKLIAPTQSLYQSLAEHHEFERRLAQMLSDKETEHQLAKGKNIAIKANEVLVLHQRLGRCRQAISKIERQIELAEKR